MNIKNQKSTIKNQPRGSVIVLVVAVLALLAVIGTVYIVSARSELGGAAAGANSANLDNAQKAVNDISLQTVGDALLDGRGNVGGLVALGPFGIRVGRAWDMPEGDPAAYFTNPPQPNAASYNAGVRDQSWLADGIYRPKVNNWNPYIIDTRYNALSILSPWLYDPASGQYDIPLYNNTAGYPPNFRSNNMFHVVADGSVMPGGSLASGMPALMLPNGTPTFADADGYINLLPFSDASGVRYRFGVRIVDTSSMANVNVGMVNPTGTNTRLVNNNAYYDGYWLNYPTIFDATTHFRTPADPPAAINSLAGRLGPWIPSSAYPSAPTEYFWEQAAFRFERPDVFVTTPFDAADELELRSLGVLGTLATPRPASATPGAAIWPNTMGNRIPNTSVVQGNPHRAFYTAYSYSRDLRPYADPVDGTGVSTAYQVIPQGGTWAAPPPAPPAPWTVASVVWPQYPAPVAANPDISSYVPTNAQQAAETLAVAATNIATAMDHIAGYSPAESRAFAANYMTTRWNSWAPYRTKQIPGSSPAITVPVYTMPAGPSFIDATGICIRTGVATPSAGNFGAAAPATALAGAANHAYLGFAAQPFINEVAISTQSNPSAPTPDWEEQDCAVELYNPFDEAISLQDFALSLDGTIIDFTDTSGTKDQWVPPRGYFVIFANKNRLDTAPVPVATTSVHTDTGSLGTAQTMAMANKTKVYLMRRYYDRASGAKQWAAVDEFGVTNIADLTNATNYPPPQPTDAPQAKVLFEARPNFDDTSTPALAQATILSRWAGIIHDPTVAEVAHTHDGLAPATTLSLGGKNDGAVPSPTPVPLYDKTLELYASTGPNADRIPLDNAADFGRILRITNEFDPTSNGIPTGNNTLSLQLANKIKTPDLQVNGTDFPAEASVRFDFRPDPAGVWGGTPTAAFKPGDARAAKLLQCLSFTDRVSDYTLLLDDNNAASRGLSKLRIPGKINVNTASPEVLSTIPVLAANPKLIGAIMAYRMRTTTADPRIPANATWNLESPPGGTPLDFTSFPGYGIRSIGELEIPISLYWENNPTIAPPPTAIAAPVPTNTLYERQLLWGSLSNTLTTRSDTFVLYAYLEAVKMNPRYNGSNFVHVSGAANNKFDNATDWYLNTTGPGGGITDDPNNPAAPLLRLSRRRWVAIIDRSSDNYSRYVLIPGPTPAYVLDPRFAQPKIVATKDLPQ